MVGGGIGEYIITPNAPAQAAASRKAGASGPTGRDHCPAAPVRPAPARAPPGRAAPPGRRRGGRSRRPAETRPAKTKGGGGGSAAAAGCAAAFQPAVGHASKPKPGRQPGDMGAPSAPKPGGMGSGGRATLRARKPKPPGKRKSSLLVWVAETRLNWGCWGGVRSGDGLRPVRRSLVAWLAGPGYTRKSRMR